MMKISNCVPDTCSSCMLFVFSMFYKADSDMQQLNANCIHVI